MTAAASGQLNRQLLRLSALLQLEKRARNAAQNELPFVMVNETAEVLPYQQAALWEGGAGGRVAALSGVSAPDPAGAYALWLKRLLAALAASPAPRAVDPLELPPDVASGWADHLPPHAFWLPLAAGGRVLGGLLFARAEPWSEADAHLLAYVGDAYAHAWLLAHARRVRLPGQGGARRRWAAAAALLLILGLGAMPVRQSALAPAEVIPRAPVLVRAPFDGVIDSVAVAPNQTVAAGQPLLTLDTAQLLAKHRVALKAREVTQTEYQQTAQQAVFDPRVKGRLAILQGKLEQEAAEAAYLQTLLDRATLAAPMAGVAVFENPNDWIGRPVAQGERIMMLADPREVELEIRLAVGDALPFAPDAEVAFFLNVAPDAPARGRLTSAGYRAQPTPEGTVAYRLKADLEAPPESLRIGLKGTAKIYGETAPLALWVLRRPIAMVRQWLAF
ncbi:efflux RND transporter periplasmic adaptor subunit [Azospirillum sp.]|uniref:efflux RND transporter periplasmic adaptor subunit n=1 Tax=Azospirillum sp. TaxID=34012 RepID=UPI003D70CE3B